MTKVTICHVISGYFRNDARVFIRQCGSLIKAGYNVVLLTNDGEGDEEVGGVRIISCTSKPTSRFRALLFAKSIFGVPALRVNAHIYQLHSPELLPLVKILKNKGKKVIYDAHEDMPSHIVEKEFGFLFLRKLVSFFFEYYQSGIFKIVDEIISPHKHVIEKTREKHGKGLVIPNFPIVKDGHDGEWEEFKSRPLRVCYTGTVYDYSNQKAIASAVASIPGLQYAIAGHLGEHQRANLTRELGDERFSFHGRLTQRELLNFYKGNIAGIVIYDYRRNLGGKVGSFATNKIFEYMEAGLPIICTDFEVWQDIIGRYECGICVSPGDVNAIREALAMLSEDRLLAFRLGQNGRRAVQSEFRWDAIETVYLSVFSRLGNVQ